MQWSDLVRRQPRLAEIAHARLIEPGVVLVATIRADGTPRLSPVEPYVLDDELWLAMMWGSQGDERKTINLGKYHWRGRMDGPTLVIEADYWPGDLAH